VPQLIIFIILVLVIVLAVVGWVMDVIGGIVGGVWGFLITLHYAWLIGFAVVSLTIAIVRRILSRGEHSIAWTMFQICTLTTVVIFIVVPVANSRRWNHTFNCVRDWQCHLGNKCVAGFCTVPFGGDHIGLAEFTQGQFRDYTRNRLHRECDKIPGGRVKDIEKRYDCNNAVDGKVDELFGTITSPERCQYFELAAQSGKALPTDDDAPMPCIGRDQAAQICSDLGGRLPTRKEYQSMFEDREFSCANTVMSGLDQFNGLVRRLRAREIRRMKDGPGCGTGKFRKACEKYRDGNTAEGLCDVFGNVAEWTADGGAVGGGFRSNAAAMRGEVAATGPQIDVGFRCIILDEHLVEDRGIF